MKDIFFDMLSLLLVILALWRMKPVRPITDIRRDYLSVENCRSYRGLLALLIVLHHLSQGMTSGFLIPVISLVGFLVVAVFFFLSGYGLQISYMTKGEAYRKGFLARRLPRVLIPYVIITLLYWIANEINGRHYTAVDVLLSIVRGIPVATNSWYVVSIIVFYVYYALLMRLCGQKNGLMLLLGAAGYVAYCMGCRGMGFGAWWYNTSHLLIVGMAWAAYEKTIVRIVSKRYVLTVLLLLGITLAVALLHYVASVRLPGVEMKLFTQPALALLFTLIVLLVLLKLRIGNPVLRFLGDLSLEIYLVHGMFCWGLRGNVVHIQNDAMWAVAVIGCTMVSAVALHHAFAFLLKRYDRFVLSARG